MIRNGLELQVAMQIVNCTEVETLYEIFPSNSKGWVNERYIMMQKDFATFVCSLDGPNCKALMKYLDEQLDIQLGEKRQPITETDHRRYDSRGIRI